MDKVRLLLVDDHKVVRDGIKYMLTMQDKYLPLISEAESGEEALQMVKSMHYDLIIMDIRMSGINGIEATKKILAIDRKTKILGLSMFDEDHQIVKFLNAGALGYLLKNAGSEELHSAIKTVLEGKNYYSSDVALKLIEPFRSDIVNYKQRKASRRKQMLSEREIEIIKMISNEFTNEEISEKLYISKRTVDSHRQNILNKIGVKNTVGIIKYAIKNELID